MRPKTMFVQDLFAMSAEATRLERERCLAAVEAEPELPGDMPDEAWEAISKDRDAATQFLRLVVRQTKAGIRDRILEI